MDPIISETPREKHNVSGYRIVDMEILASVFADLLCPNWDTASLVLCDRVSARKGLSSLLYLKCQTRFCLYVKEFSTSTSNVDRSYDVNKRMIYTMRTLGQGHSGIEKFTALMNMPRPMTFKNYTNAAKKVLEATKEVAKQTMDDAATDLHQSSSEDKDVIDVGVSCDGTWQKRGFSSLNGVFVAISIDNGKVIDIEPMNRHCKPCSMKEGLKKSDPVVYQEWKNSHICRFNYQGSAGGMECEGAKQVFKRSVNEYNLRYTQFLGDGDSKSFLSVQGTYGDNVEIKKLECVGHYQKRVGTRLRNLKKKEKGLGGRGKLTDAVIDRLQNFFGVAIRQNSGNLEEMKKAVLASLFHVASSKVNNWHYPHCPTGSDSWCKYNVDKENGTNFYKPGPGLPLAIVCKIKPVYAALSKESELIKCLHGKTQNANESFNDLIWERVPKTDYVTLPTLELGVYGAVGHFNIGMKSSVLIYEKLMMVPGVYTLHGCKKTNRKRLNLSIYKSNKRNKLKRQSLRRKKLKMSDKINETEVATYIPGGF